MHPEMRERHSKACRRRRVAQITRQCETGTGTDGTALERRNRRNGNRANRQPRSIEGQHSLAEISNRSIGMGTNPTRVAARTEETIGSSDEHSSHVPVGRERRHEAVPSLGHGRAHRISLCRVGEHQLDDSGRRITVNGQLINLRIPLIGTEWGTK